MTEDESNADELRSPDAADTDAAEIVDWTTVSADPHPTDLGYETAEWERIPTTDRDQVIFLPGNEEDLEDDAFVVLDETDLCDLVTRR